MGIVEKIRGLVQGGDIKRALNELSSWAEKNDEDLYNTSILLMSRYNNLKRKTNMGLISDAEAERNYNRLAFSIISTLEDIEEPNNVAAANLAPAQQPPARASSPVVDPKTESSPEPSRRPKKIFISYAREDRGWVDKLKNHLASLQRKGLVESWDDSSIWPGKEWNASIMKALGEADIYILMVTVDFIASDYINQNELPVALKRAEGEENVQIVPVIVRPCNWFTEFYNSYQALPKDGKPISTWDNEDKAYLDVVEGLMKLIPQ